MERKVREIVYLEMIYKAVEREKTLLFVISIDLVNSRENIKMEILVIKVFLGRAHINFLSDLLKIDKREVDKVVTLYLTQVLRVIVKTKRKEKASRTVKEKSI